MYEEMLAVYTNINGKYMSNVGCSGYTGQLSGVICIGFRKIVKIRIGYLTKMAIRLRDQIIQKGWQDLKVCNQANCTWILEKSWSLIIILYVYLRGIEININSCQFRTNYLYIVVWNCQGHQRFCNIFVKGIKGGDEYHLLLQYTQRRVQPNQCYFTVQITGSNFEYSL